MLSLVTAPIPELVGQVAAIADLADRDPLVIGSHLEGPFLDPAHRGAHDPALLTDPATGDVDRLIEAGRLQSALVLSPPGGGKTTLLRDLVRLISLGTEDLPPMRVSLVDERGELAASYRGRPQLDVGPRTDVLDGCPKAMAVPMLLRAMTPQVIALDELALDEDAGAVRSAAGCGAVLLATAHAASPEELARRPALAGLLAGDIFRRTVTISGAGADRTYRVEALP